MAIGTVLLALGVACACISVVAAISITRELDRRGMPTPFPLFRWYVLRNLGRYRDVTKKETGEVGPLFNWYVVPINLAWVLAVLGLVLTKLGE